MTEGYVLARPVVRPALVAGWTAWPGPGDEARLLLTPAETPGTDRVWAALPAHPLLRTRPDGAPRFSLTVVLSRRPAPGTEDLGDLVEFATLALDLSLLPAETEMAAARTALGSPVRPLVGGATTTRLHTVEREWTAVATASTAGAGAVTVTLPRVEALDALAAVDGAPSTLLLTATTAHRTPPTSRRIRLRGDWSEVHGRLAQVASPAGQLTVEAVRAVLAELLADRTVDVEADEERVVLEPVRAGTVVTAWLRTIATVLQRLPGEVGYVLRPRPPVGAALDVAFTDTVEGSAQVELSTTLDRLLAGALVGRDRDAYVHVVVTDPSAATGFAEVGRQQRTRAARPRPGTDPPLALFAGQVRSLPLLLTPDASTRVPATALLADVAVRRPLTDQRIDRLGLRRWALDDVVLDPVVVDGDPQVSLPVVDDAAADWWTDRLEATKLWYAPRYELLPFSTDLDPAQSGFVMTFSHSGVTQDGQTSLTGRVRFRLRPVVPEAATAAAGGDASRLHAVEAANLAVTLEVPFRDTTSRQTLDQAFAATLTTEATGSGDVLVADVDLLDTWVRLTYGALARPGFQDHPARLRVTYSYSGYVPTGNVAVMSFGGKELLQDNLLENTVVPAGSVRSRRPPVDWERPERIPVQHIPIEHTLIEHTLPVWHPPVLDPPVQRPDRVVRSLVEDQATQALFPCAEFGGSYRQQTAEGEIVVGCQDALTLGEVRYRQFEELLDLRSTFGTTCRVYRSVQQPGVFLVVPARYRITRYGPEEPDDRPYRPVVFVYATITGDPAQHRYRISATLQPDLSPDVRAELQHRLVAYSPHERVPVVLLPTDPAVGASEEFSWAVGAGEETPVVQRVWDTLQVTISTGLANSLLVTRMIEGSGFTGGVRYTLPDGLVVDSSLLLDSFPCGPWSGGPVTAEIAGTTATLTNHVERVVTVPELLTSAAAGELSTVAVGTALAPGASTTVTVADGVSAAWPRTVPDAAPLTIEEMRVFVEDVLVELQLLNTLDHATHGLAGLHVDVTIPGRGETVAGADLPERAVTALPITLPVTNYLGAAGLELRFTRRGSDGTTATSAAVAWNPAVQGTVITVDWALVQ